MKKNISTLICITSIVLSGFGQTWLNPHTQVNLPNAPASSKLNELISANGGNSIGQSSMPNAGTIKTMRNFHHMEIDYKYNFFPMDGILNPDTCSCANVWCNGGGCNDIMQGGGTKSGFESTKGFYCAWNSPSYGFTEIYSALESIFPKYNGGSCPNTTINRGYPNKWYSLSEFGGINNIKTNFKNYVLSFLKTNCPNNLSKTALVNVLEIGNEPWGDSTQIGGNGYPGKNGYHQMLIATVEACREYYGGNDPKNWRIKLSLAAFRAHNANSGPFGERFYYIEDAIPDSLKQYFGYVEIHPYAFNIAQFNAGNLNGGVTETPESDDGGFLTFKNLIDWRNQKMPHAKVNITEFGWNAGVQGDGCSPLGESTQAAYYMRAYLLSARYNIHRSFVYGYTDQNEWPLYCTTGLFKNITSNTPRKSYQSIITTVNSSLGDKRFLKALNENTDQSNNGQNGAFVYLFGDAAGTPTHIVAWRPVKLAFEDNNYPANASTYTTINLPSNNMTASNGDSYFYLGWDNSQNSTITNNGSGTVNISGSTSSSVGVKLSGMPIVIPINANGCKYDSTGTLVGCLPTGIAGSSPETIINVYHSYEDGSIYINTGNYSGNVSVKIYDVTGRAIYKSAYNASGTHTFNFKGQSLGVYMIEIMLNDGTTITKKIVTK